MTCTNNPTYATVFEKDISAEFMWGQAREIHGANVVAGWWTDPKTGASIIETRNRGEIMMLIVSELSEASYGHNEAQMDDKLPHLPMFDVELADAAIRLLDLLGVEERHAPAQGFSIPGLTSARRTLAVLDRRDEQLMTCVNAVSRAMEHHRKGYLALYVASLWDALEHIFALAEVHEIDLMPVIAEKRAFNATRADHKLENRLKDGGKAY